MEASATLPKSSFLRILYICLLVPLLLFAPGLVGEVKGQEKVLATEVTHTSGNNKNTLTGCGLGGLLPCINQPTVLNRDNALADNDSYARLLASPGLALDLASYDGIIELRFPQVLQADTWSYVRIGGDTDLFGALLGGSLGEALGGVLGAVLLGNQEIVIDARLGGAAPILSRSSSQGFDTDRVKMLVDQDGNYHLAIRPNGNYDRIRITNTTGSLLGLGNEKTLDVYNAFYFADEGDDCGLPAFTSFDGSGGLSLAVLEDENQYLERAIDNDPDTYSELKTGSLLSVDVASAYSQHFYFPSRSAADHTFNIKLALATSGALNLDALGSLQIVAWDGNQPVYESSLAGGVLHGLDLLTLLQDGNPATFVFAPGRPFDRVEVRQNSIVGASLLATAIRIYDVQRYDGVHCVNPEIETPDPTDPMLIQRDCDATVIDFGYANFPYNAVDGNNDTYTTLQAGSGIAVGIDAYDGFIELGFGQRTAGTTTYVRIDFDEEVLLGLLDGSLGQFAGDLVDNTLFGSHYFTVEAMQDGDPDPVLEASSNNGFGSEPVRIVQDKNGHYYVAITPTDDYNSIRITERLSALVGLGEVRTMNVYHACTSTGADICEQAFATYSESSGISLDLLGLGGAGVQNAHLAIDDDDLSVEGDETFSEISIGAAGIGTEIFQFVEFHTLSSPADYFKVKIGFENTSAVNLELLNNVVVRAYNGDDLVYSQRLQNGLVAGLDILGLLSTEDVVTIPIGPGRAFDRIAVGFEAVLDLGVSANPLRVYSIKRFGADCPDPNPLPNVPETESPFNGPDCGIELGEFENVNFAYNAIDGDIDTYATLSAGSGVVLGLGSYSGYLELGYDAPVPALETSYIRIDMPDEGLLDALVGGSLGTWLADVGDIVLFGNHYFDLSVRRPDGTEIHAISSNFGFPNNNVRLVQDAVGRYYIAYTADEPYQSVRITLNNTAVAGLDAVTTMNVYSMCRETVFDPCEQATFTSFDGSGLSLSLFEGASPAGVIHPQYVIDDNNSNYAELTLGGIGAGVAATIYQDIYFKTKVTTAANDQIRLRMQVPSSLANVSLLGAYRVYLYNGEEEVEALTLEDALLLDTDLLALLNSGSRVNVEIELEPGITYDRVRFEIASLAGVGVASPVRLYNIYRISDACPDPDYEVPPFDECADAIIDNNEHVDDIQNLIDGNHNSYATIRSDAGIVGGFGQYSGYVELGFSGVVPGGTSSYIRIGYDQDILDALLAGSLGGVVSDLLNGIALGDHYFNVIVKDALGGDLFERSSENLFAGDETEGTVRLVQDTKGRYYLEITPTDDYQSIRLEDHTTALLGLLSSEGHLDVYGLCHTPTTFECVRAFSTSYEGSGLNLDALNLGGAGVQNAFWAIDQNTSSASTLSLGTLSVLNNTIQQNIQFDQTLNGDDEDQVLIRMQVGGGTVSAGILQELSIIGLLNGQEVFVRDFEQAFAEANIYDVLNSPSPVDVIMELETGESIDEIAIRLGNSIAGIGVAPNVSIYHVIPLCDSFLDSYLEVTKNNAWADGLDHNEVTAFILNQDGDPINNQEVEFTIIHVDGTETTETATTNTDGEAVVQITSTTAGVASVTATVGGMIISEGSPAEVTFIIPNNLSITKEADDDEVTAGGSTTFTVIITNDGPAPIAVGKVIPLNERPSTGLTITDYDVTSGNATVSGTGNSATVTITAEVPVDGTIVLSVTADVAADAPDEVENGIDVWGPDRDPETDDPDDSDDTDPIPVIRDYGIDDDAIVKVATDGPDAEATAGEEFAYTVTVTNQGPSTILTGTTLYLQDELSPGQIISSITSTNVTVNGPADGEGFFTVTTTSAIAEGESFTLTVTADVAADIAEDEVSNIIHIWVEDPDGDLSDPDGTAESPEYPVVRDYGFDNDAIAKTATDGPGAEATAGETFEYTVTVTNQGPSTILSGTTLYLLDKLSPGQTIHDITSTDVTVNGPADSDGFFTVTTTSAIAEGESFTLTVTADVPADIAEDDVSNIIHIWAEDPTGDYSTPDGTATTPDYPVVRDYGIDDDAIAKVATDGPDAEATAGEEFAYTVTVTNQGPSTILAGTTLYLQDELSSGQTINDITSLDVTVNGPADGDGFFTVTTTSAIAEGESFTLTVTADVDADIAEDDVSNIIHIWVEDPDGDYDTPDGTAESPDYPVVRDYGIDDDAIVKVATDGPDAEATAGEEFSYTVTVTNQGPSTILAGTTLYLQDELSSGQTINDITSLDVTVNGPVDSEGFFTVTTTTAIAEGESFTLTMTADVNADITEDEVSNIIHIWVEDPDGDLSDPDGTAESPEYPVIRDYGIDDDAIAKIATDGPDAEATAGETFEYTVTVTNQGPSTILAGTTLYLQDELSSGQTINDITSLDVTVNGPADSDGFFTVTTTSAIAEGESFTLTITAGVAADITEDDVSNIIHIWVEDPDGDYDTPDGTATTPDYPVVRDYGIDDDAIVKVATDGPDAEATAGEEFAYTVTVTNQGPSTILAGTTLYLQDELSSGQTIKDITSSDVTVNGPADSDGFFTVTTTTAIAEGESFTLTITADVAADIAEDDVSNTIHIWVEDPAGDYSTPDGTAESPEYPVVRESILSIIKEADDARVVAGGTTSFTLTITNDGPSAIAVGETISLGERPGAGVTITGYEMISGNGIISGSGNAAVITTSAVIPVGGTITVSVTADVDADAGEEITNSIDVWGPDKDPDDDPKDDDSDMPPIPVDRESNLSIEKEADDASVVAGGSTSFTLTITNNGPSVIDVDEDISLVERPGDGVTITGYEVIAGSVTLVGDGNTAVLTTTGKIALGGTITVRVTADVDADAPEFITNGIDVWGPDKDPDDDPKDDDSDTPPIPVVREHSLSITKEADDERVVAGGTTSFTLTITNEGPSAIASGEVISLVERPSTGLTITGYEVTSGNGAANGAGNTATVTTNAVIAVGGTITVVVTADVDADAPEFVTNGIDVWGPDKDPDEDPKDDDSDTPPIPVDRVSNLSIVKEADEDRVKAGESTSFTVTITNDGPSVIDVGENISLAERPGAGVTITGYEVIGGPATLVGDGNTAVLTTTGKLAPGGTITVRITANVAANAGETITNGIDVWGPDKDPDDDPKDDDSDTPPIPVDHQSVLSITKEADDARVAAGGTTSFTLTITNEGPAAIAQGKVISLIERPGEGLTITGYEVTSGNGTANGTGNRATVTTDAVVAVGGTITVRVTANVDADAGETITNGITVWGPDKDPDDDPEDDRHDTPPIPVDRESNLSIAKEADDETVIAGGTTSFTVTVTNDGPAAIAAGETITVEERPSDGLDITGYEAISGNATVSGTGNSAQLVTTSTIPVGGTITFAVMADVTAPAGATVSNGIAVWGPGKIPGTDDEDDETETPDIPVTAPYTLSIEKVADQSLVTAGQPTTFTVTVTNNGPLAIAEGEHIRLEERPGSGVTITDYEILSGVGTISGSGNQATITTTGVFDAGTSIVVRITADVSASATGTITNGIAVWRPDNEGEPDDEDDMTPVPIDASLMVPNLFTPNGDGVNDMFVVRNLMQYQNRELTVLNRWGNQVYRSSNYNNDWDGGTLAEGTYYYILRVRNSSSDEWQTHKGPVAVIRVTNR